MALGLRAVEDWETGVPGGLTLVPPWFQPGKTVMVDACMTCRCTVQAGVTSGFKLECRQTTCQACPVVREAVAGGCWGVSWVLVGSRQWGLTRIFKYKLS